MESLTGNCHGESNEIKWNSLTYNCKGTGIHREMHYVGHSSQTVMEFLTAARPPELKSRYSVSVVELVTDAGKAQLHKKANTQQ